jgi:NAD(P)-dependent dehydrogenase (short-subunit alcohol dehydrogenase family)
VKEALLQGKVAVVTGGGRGIGAAIARKLALMAGKVIIAGRTERELKATASAIQGEGGSCDGIVCDVSDLGSVEQFARAMLVKFARIDILVNNAGVGNFGGPLHSLKPEQWDRVMNTNLRGVYYMIRAFAPQMIEQKSGDIINISSIASKNPLPNGAAYAASKWGLNGLTYSVAEELRGYNIRVSVVCPGSVDTDLSPHAGKNKDRMLKPDDVAHVVEMIVTQTSQSFASEVILRPTLKP